MRGRPRQDPDKRFFDNVRAMENRCWEWIGAKDKEKGYGYFWTGEVNTRAHRYSYSRFVGPIPAGLDVLRSCHNKLCVNPMHLQVGIHDQLTRARQQRAKTHCPHGHAYDEKNTYVYRNVHGNLARNCRACMRERDARKSQRSKEKQTFSGVNN